MTNLRDVKQLILMKREVDLFESGEIDLFKFVSDLSGLLNALESVSKIHYDIIQSEINTLEMIHDSVQDSSIARWQGDLKKDREQSVSNLKKIISSVMEEYLKNSDSSVLECAISLSSNWLQCPFCHDAWATLSEDAMVVCPNCSHSSHNPKSKSSST
ncbi:MAG: hypothetical protein WCG42_08790 [Parachlamydiaceae bacterium]